LRSALVQSLLKLSRFWKKQRRASVLPGAMPAQN
jgi:hypothetical protein